VKPIVCIAGPTASGKSALAIRVAKAVGGEVINADSMQVYGDLPVLSARPPQEEMEGVPHHLFGHIEWDRSYSTGEWVREVEPVILDCLARGVVPILTGGTGLYFKAIFEGLAHIPPIGCNSEIETAKILRNEGIAHLRKLCEGVDLEATSKILGDDPQRLGRIYGVWLQTGVKLSTWQAITVPLIPKSAARYAVVMPERQALYDRINTRFDNMVELGGVKEARRVYDERPKLSGHFPMLKAIGLSHLTRHFKGELSYDEAIDLAKRDSRRLAKRQMTWFRNQTPDWPQLTTPTECDNFAASLIGLNLPD